jgi:ABC-2 type transport system ATP-binding protein
VKVDAAAQFEHVSKVYRTGLLGSRAVHALRNVSLTIPRGEVFGILGPNRAGKTTLVKILLSICRPTSGRITRLGKPYDERRTLNRVGYLHESQAFPRYLTACGLMQFYAALSQAPGGIPHERIAQLLARVGLTDRSHEPIGRFSKGMVQRLALAQALVNDPDLLVLDEPTEGLDLVARKLLYEVIEERRAEGKTAILVSHSLADVERLCDRVAVIRHGEVAFEGPLSELRGSEPRSNALSGEASRLETALEPLYEDAAS